MAHELEYVVKDALMICDKGAAPGFFMPTHNMHIKASGCLLTNDMDKLPLVNIPTFGMCSLTMAPCVPVPTNWEKTYKAKVKHHETLLYRSCIRCSLGGNIQFVTSGQIPLPQDALEDIHSLQEAGEKNQDNEGWGWWDTVELVPVIGSIVGMVREGAKGNWGMMALNLGFLVMDVAGIFSFGATTAAATAGKASVKAGIKVAAKATAKQTGKSGLKKALHLSAKGAKESFKNSIDKITRIISKGKKCIYACFPAGTLVHTETGLRPIEEIQVGDRVWSYNEKTGEKGLKEVLYTTERETDITLHIKGKDEELETTPAHPFYAEGNWTEASELQESDKIRTIGGEKEEIKNIRYSYTPKKVFNFEVADWHTYFVGWLGWLVHNARPCLARLKHMPEWLQKIMKGNYFNYIREMYYKRMGGFSEVVLESGKRLDSYIPKKEIISRKFTQLGKVSVDTGKKYIDEMVKKYKPGTPIKQTQRNAEAIEKGGKALTGEMILEVPVQKGNIPKEVLDYATNKNVSIRDINKTIYN